MDIDRTRDRVVEAMLPHAAFDGWTRVALAAAANDLDLDLDLPARLFPGGAADLVAHFVGLADRRMVEDLAARGPRGGRVGERVFLALRFRFERWAEHREAIRRAAAVLALPHNLKLAANLAWGTADSVWAAIEGGEARPRDFTYFSKRASLAALYSATLFYWLEDSSPDLSETWGFLRRRMNALSALPRLNERVRGLFGGRGVIKPPARRWGAVER